MSRHQVNARGLAKGRASGAALVCRNAFSFLGDVDMDTGEIIAAGHEHQGVSIAGRVLIYPETKGSSGGCVVLSVLARQNRQPAAIALTKPADPNIVEGAILTGVTLVSEPEEDLLARVPNGAAVTVDGDAGLVLWDD
jgi:predicted aconitase with swiveling domain